MLRDERLDPARDPEPARVDEHVHPTVALAVLGDDAHAVVLVGEVGGEANRVELGGGGLHLLGGARGKGERKALLAQHPRDREPDPRRPPGDECAGHRERP